MLGDVEWSWRSQRRGCGIDGDGSRALVSPRIKRNCGARVASTTARGERREVDDVMAHALFGSSRFWFFFYSQEKNISRINFCWKKQRKTTQALLQCRGKGMEVKDGSWERPR